MNGPNSLKDRDMKNTRRRWFSFRGLILKGCICSLVITLVVIYYTFNNTPTSSPIISNDNIGTTDDKTQRNSLLNDQNHHHDKVMSRSSFSKSVFPKKKFVHLDLKGMPPKVQYYRQLFPALAKWGVNGLLIEYEDMFPYFGRLASITNGNAYTKAEILEINKIAALNHLEVIPLIQTFGHMEYILKLEEYMDLREAKLYSQVICPSKNASLELIRELVDQIMQLHTSVKYLHLGCDEVYYLGMCPVCEERMEKYRLEKDDLFLQHVKTVANYASESYGVRAIIWDDLLRSKERSKIQKYGLGSIVDIVVWDYTDHVNEKFSSDLWEKYAASFSSVWAASAFKGAIAPDTQIANETFYLQNHIAWEKVFAEYRYLVPFTGIIITGWQRYDHFSVLSELLPSAIPSLVTDLLYMNLPNTSNIDTFQILANVSTQLKCKSWLEFCTFPGAEVYDSINSLYKYKARFDLIRARSQFKGWVKPINLDQQFSSASHIKDIYSELNSLKYELEYLETNLVKELSEIYSKPSVNEWMITYFNPFYDEVAKISKGLGSILEKTSFPVRPLPSNYETHAQTEKSKDLDKNPPDQ